MIAEHAMSCLQSGCIFLSRAKDYLDSKKEHIILVRGTKRDFTDDERLQDAYCEMEDAEKVIIAAKKNILFVLAKNSNFWKEKREKLKKQIEVTA